MCDELLCGTKSNTAVLPAGLARLFCAAFKKTFQAGRTPNGHSVLFSFAVGHCWLTLQFAAVQV